MSFLLISHDDLWNFQLVCKQWYKEMIACKKLCSLQGKFTDVQINHIMTYTMAEIPQWKREISILGGCTGEGFMVVMKCLWCGPVVEWTSVTMHNCIDFSFALLFLCEDYLQYKICYPGLVELDLSHNRSLYFNDIRCNCYNLFSYGIFPNIQKLRLRDMDIRDPIFMVLQRCSKLKELDLSGNRLLTNYGLRSYYTFQRDAERVDNQYETDIKEEDARLGAAVRVTVVNCPHITDRYVQELRKEFPTAIIQTH